MRSVPSNSPAFELLSLMLRYNPKTRITAEEALQHAYFTSGEAASSGNLSNIFHAVPHKKYPSKRLRESDLAVREKEKEAQAAVDQQSAKRRKMEAGAAALATAAGGATAQTVEVAAEGHITAVLPSCT